MVVVPLRREVRAEGGQIVVLELVGSEVAIEVAALVIVELIRIAIKSVEATRPVSQATPLVVPLLS